MRIFLYAALLHCFSYALLAQTFLPTPINFSTGFSIPSSMAGRFIFSDTSYKPNKLFQIWNSAAGATTSLNKYYRVKGGLCIDATDEVNRPAVCNSDTSYLHIFNANIGGALTGNHGHKNPLFGISIHYDVCAPNRTRSLAGVSRTYQETYPNWSDKGGGAFGYLSRTGGADQIFSDTNKRRVISPSVPSGTVILKHPFPNELSLFFL